MLLILLGNKETYKYSVIALDNRSVLPISEQLISYPRSFGLFDACRYQLAVHKITIELLFARGNDVE